MRKLFAGAVATSVLTLAIPGIAWAHVIVTPNQADVGQELVFNVRVPNERSVAVTSIKLDIPKGVEEVTPTIVPGWNITTDGGDTVTAVTWTGTISVGEREDFSFGAQVPATATQLDWKAYQTYADGTIVHWDQKPAGSDDTTGNARPYSITKVINDLGSSNQDTASTGSSNKTTLAFVFSIVALALSASSLFMRPKKKP